VINTNHLSAEDAAVILELAPILDINFAKRLERGSERKFYIETKQGERQNLVVAPIRELKWRSGDDRINQYIASLYIPVPRMVCNGTLSDGALLYELYTWLDGEDLFTVMPSLSPMEQFELGVKCGETARKLHTLPPLGNPEPWCCKHRVQEATKSYNEKSMKTQAEGLLIKYLQDNVDLTFNRPQTFAHGDWCTDNLILLPDGQVGIIDCGIPVKDPWFEFWSTVNESAHFCTGQLKGYFEGESPAEYFPLLAFYVAMETMHWGYETENILKIFDGMRSNVPSWYFTD